MVYAERKNVSEVEGVEKMLEGYLQDPVIEVLLKGKKQSGSKAEPRTRPTARIAKLQLERRVESREPEPMTMEDGSLDYEFLDHRIEKLADYCFRDYSMRVISPVGDHVYWKTDMEQDKDPHITIDISRKGDASGRVDIKIGGGYDNSLKKTALFVKEMAGYVGAEHIGDQDICRVAINHVEEALRSGQEYTVSFEFSRNRLAVEFAVDGADGQLVDRQYLDEKSEGFLLRKGSVDGRRQRFEKYRHIKHYLPTAYVHDNFYGPDMQLDTLETPGALEHYLDLNMVMMPADGRVSPKTEIGLLK